MAAHRSDAALAFAFVALIFLFSFSRQVISRGTGADYAGTVAAGLVTFVAAWAVVRWARGPTTSR